MKKIIAFLLWTNVSFLVAQDKYWIDILKSKKIELQDGTDSLFKNSTWKTKYYFDYSVSLKGNPLVGNDTSLTTFKNDSIYDARADKNGSLKLSNPKKFTIQMFNSNIHSNIIRICSKRVNDCLDMKIFKATSKYIVYEIILYDYSGKKWRPHTIGKYLLIRV